MMKKKVYICAPLGGNVKENLEKVKQYTRYALLCGVTPVVPHFYAMVLDDDITGEREIGREAGASLLWFCDELWIFGDTVTNGMEWEINLCRNLNIRTRTVSETKINKLLGGKCE